SGGRTMMGIKPADWPDIAARMPASLAAYGANCGVGPAELLATVIGMSDAAPPGTVLIAKGNCGMPELTDAGIEYTGTTELMSDYARLARDVGVQIIGGCCGTTPAHTAAMREALETRAPMPRPSIPQIIETLGEVSKLAMGTDAAAEAKARRRRE
ncbi:MAG: homocysteine S-methyltransferase family protein, partial [Pseudomonadota bacterium]